MRNVIWESVIVWAFIAGPFAFALVDAVSREQWRWTLAGYSKPVWVALIVLLSPVGAFAYLATVRPRLRQLHG